MRIVTAEQMKRVEQAAAQEGLAFGRMMENAGAVCANWVLAHLIKRPETPVAVLCGKGKNGGDGFVIARKLHRAGCRVTVVQTAEQAAGDEGEMLAKLLEYPVPVVRSFSDVFDPKALLAKQEILIDALFGTGFRGQPDAQTAQLITAMNAAAAPIVSVDLPSGLCCDSGEAQGCFVHAAYTLAIAAQKPVHILQPAAAFCGAVVTLPIGLTDAQFQRCGADGLFSYEMQELKRLLPPRSPLAHKGDCGHVLSICGSRTMQGAAVLAARSATVCGAGIVTAAFPESAYPAIGAKLTEQLLTPLPGNRQGSLSVKALPALLAAAEKADAVLLGCGLGLNLDTREIVYTLLEQCRKPLILDADGINAVAADINMLKKLKSPLTLTPHPGEMARLTGEAPQSDYRARIQTARRFAEEYGVTLVLKGTNTVVASGGSQAIYLNRSGNAGLAQGGAGDMLAGMLAAISAQSGGALTPMQTACCAAYLHGAAADKAAQDYSQRGMEVTDCIRALKHMLRSFDSAG